MKIHALLLLSVLLLPILMAPSVESTPMGLIDKITGKGKEKEKKKEKEKEKGKSRLQKIFSREGASTSASLPLKPNYSSSSKALPDLPQYASTSNAGSSAFSNLGKQLHQLNSLTQSSSVRRSKSQQLSPSAPRRRASTASNASSNQSIGDTLVGSPTVESRRKGANELFRDGIPSSPYHEPTSPRDPSAPPFSKLNMDSRVSSRGRQSSSGGSSIELAVPKQATTVKKATAKPLTINTKTKSKLRSPRRSTSTTSFSSDAATNGNDTPRPRTDSSSSAHSKDYYTSSGISSVGPSKRETSTSIIRSASMSRGPSSQSTSSISSTGAVMNGPSAKSYLYSNPVTPTSKSAATTSKASSASMLKSLSNSRQQQGKRSVMCNTATSYSLEPVAWMQQDGRIDISDKQRGEKTGGGSGNGGCP
ncbi:hypothetical protein BJ684DRAFT_15891 [Piptocephalis cylindrospora]|uniref:Ig-like domain-containing protein n=1 Tax=Piptocephalis cylindrospora TaxID=1907219 RepID=A0A4P9Y795_9FUNG|nr:hypothetical protein BJ684DRAFT_15891 [Piptocephalis cylindrospora]|eukprot:RKP13740.1 hypothetical protein BJ684DRAFT_15891 [Piptocephalis cylindrospora]